MKSSLPLFVIFLILTGCSFDNKSGIWTGTDISKNEVKDQFKDFETLYTQEKSFNEIIFPKKNLQINLSSVIRNINWNNEFYENSNNSENFYLKDSNEIYYKSKKLSSKKLNSKFLFDGKNVITADAKGNLIVHTIEDKKIIYKFNFYKKKFKKINKKLKFAIKDEIIYVSDNLGYLYALDYNKKKVVWAKNYKIPFRSNIKIVNDKIILADQDNTLYILDKISGERLKTLPTEEIVLKNNFKNSIAIGEKSIFFLNTYGSLYSVNIANSKIEWFLNLNPSLDLNVRNQFISNPVILYENKLIVSTLPYLYVLNADNGSTIFKRPITSIVKPIVSGKNLFLITKDYLLVCIDLITNNVEYSISVNKEIAKYLNTKEKLVSIKSFEILNNKLHIFLENSFILVFEPTGKIENVSRLKTKIKSYPIFVDGSILYINNKNQLVITN